MLFIDFFFFKEMCDALSLQPFLLNQWFSTQVTVGHVCRRVLVVSPRGRGASGPSQVEAKDAAEHPTLSRMSPCKTKNYPAPHVIMQSWEPRL